MSDMTECATKQDLKDLAKSIVDDLGQVIRDLAGQVMRGLPWWSLAKTRCN